ncbi:venom allergen 5 [Tribolium castaneum]|uniref:Venom allergen 5-like Protein n=1 Tax=Tribolium castaneum TaxID=7070 RepID=D2A435_TRICA|nr:PREDICTED: venom allergen 5 [Tribolium castaneum]EFA05608.1 Venom allergen 5-like Protein [Tribolium castaneum]|eukprot:XP_967911.1 PREDICTED: venom allergen 5 [Tribolium castaneum]
MFQLVLFFAQFLLYIRCDFSPKKDGVNFYCKTPCKKQGNNTVPATGCNCKLAGTRTEIDLDQFMAFRQFIVNEHNHYRNLLASGNETRGFAKSVANMQVLNYDLELEYLARCFGRGLFIGKHDGCRNLLDQQVSELRAGQNLGSLRDPPKKGFDQLKEMISGWYEQVQNLDEEIHKRFHFIKGKQIKEFTTMCWGPADSVGCARIYVKDPKKDKFAPGFTEKHTYLICNYASRKLRAIINVGGVRLYAQGPPCSKCPDYTEWKDCNDKFTSLCGIIQPIPKEQPFDFFGNRTSAETQVAGKVYTLALAFCIQILVK